MLALTVAEVAAIEARRLERLRVRRVSYLRHVATDPLRDVPDEAVRAHIDISERTGERLALRSHDAHCRWAYLMFATEGRIARSQEVRHFIARPGADPDKQMALVMRGTILALRRQRSAMFGGA
ncbi:hypothetical protein [Fulvimarina sp. MAC8]|uniref:hypothetical protein n=1 Tax=Fulvimarina sp. MAC8 TaxID=3162874 RepID=UPI0032EF7006